ncbi:hypothetical protein [Halobacillus sp. KGW1]|uniref:hypothetical protein n=1 Tax=Halobacillus sp. KGW1 TaxID=1793726 RepID=UPI00078598E6|nr:hypothetical protein [Halobacillus sp. KGW1]
MNLHPTRLSAGVEERRRQLIHKLWIMGYTEDRVGKRTQEMTLTELEQININMECRKARELK